VGFSMRARLQLREEAGEGKERLLGELITAAIR
jgi:hypothetical protein